VVGEICNTVTEVAVLVGLQIAGVFFRDRSDVSKLASFLGDGIAGFIKLLVQEVFDSSESSYVIDEAVFTRSPEPSITC